MNGEHHKALAQYIFEQVSKGLEESFKTEKDEIYAYSLDTYDAFARPMSTTLTLSYNTVEHYRSEIASADNAGEPETFFDMIHTPHDNMEAKWNYAFWLQDEVAAIGTENDPKGRELIKNWIVETGLYYDEDDLLGDMDDCMEKGRKVTQLFLQMLVKVVQQLHERYTLKVPIIIQQLEAFEGITEYNIQANGRELVKEFLDTIKEYENDLYVHLFHTILDGLEDIPEDDKDDIYAYSLLVYDDEDDPRWPTVTLGYNTISHYKSEIPNAWDEQEAKWNYAFWLQNYIAEIGIKNDEKGRTIIEKFTKYTGLYYTEKEEEENFDECMERGSKITEHFVNTLVSVVQSIHRIKKLNKPILIHELEYYWDIAEQNKEANGEALVKEFVDWIAS